MHSTSRAGLTRREFAKCAALAAAAPAFGALAAAAPAPGAPAHEAACYERIPGTTEVRCTLCPWRCVVPAGGRGRCRVRENRAGTYYSLVYGRVCALNNDPIEKKPFFHVYPGSRALSLATVGCNLRCKFCQNWDIAQADPDSVSPPFQSPDALAARAVDGKARVLAYTYNEPTIFYEFMRDCARAGRDRGVGSVAVSNGFIAEKPLQELLPLLTAIKIDLKAFTERFYAEVCEGQLQPVLNTLKRLAESGVWFEIVVLLIPTLNDGQDEIKRLSAWVCKELGPNVPLHLTRFHPAYRLPNLPATPPRTLLKARELAMAEGCGFVYTGNMPGGDGENTYCPCCKACLIQRYGHLVSACDVKDGKCPKCGTAIPGVWS